MKKTNIVMLALATMSFGMLQAACKEGAVAATEASCASLSTEEQTFAAKLSDRQKKLFCMMSVEQRKAAMVAAADPAMTADGAIDKVMKDQHVSMTHDHKSEKK